MGPGSLMDKEARAELGRALGRRAHECVQMAEARLAGYMWKGVQPSEEYLESRRSVMWFGTLLIARWLVRGAVPDDDELSSIHRRGRLAVAQGISIVNFARAYLVWRDVNIEVLTREADRLGIDGATRDIALAAVRATCDGNLLRVIANFDAHLRVLNAHLVDERELLRHAAEHDGLTGVRNRTSLYDRLAQAVSSAHAKTQRFAVMMIDLDCLKSVNDRLGHKYGDVALAEAAARLSHSVRAADTVARLGGDEFIVILPNTTAADAEKVADRMLVELKAPLILVASPVVLGASIGIAEYPNDGDCVDGLLSAADAAMYLAKRDPAKRVVASSGSAA